MRRRQVQPVALLLGIPPEARRSYGGVSMSRPKRRSPTILPASDDPYCLLSSSPAVVPELASIDDDLVLRLRICREERLQALRYSQQHLDVTPHQVARYLRPGHEAVGGLRHLDVGDRVDVANAPDHHISSVSMSRRRSAEARSVVSPASWATANLSVA